MNKSDAAWLAGLYEGEGCLTKVNKYYPYLKIKMSDLDVIERARAVTGVGKIYTEKRREAHHKQLYVWIVGKRADVIAICKAMWPNLGERRRQRIREYLPTVVDNCR